MYRREAVCVQFVGTLKVHLYHDPTTSSRINPSHPVEDQGHHLGQMMLDK